MRTSCRADEQGNKKIRQMKATQIGEAIRNKAIGSKTYFFELDRPMKFLDVIRTPNTPESDDQFKESSHVAVCCFKGIVPRTVIHAASVLAGGTGFDYGSYGARIVDGINNADAALMLQGYVPE